MSGGNEYDGTGGKTYSDTSASSNGGKVTKRNWKEYLEHIQW